MSGMALMAEEPGGVVKRSEWNGYAKLEFEVGGRAAFVVVPKVAAAGKPWIWRTEFFGHEPQADLALLEKGFHAAYVDVQNLYGGPTAIAAMAAPAIARAGPRSRRLVSGVSLFGVADEVGEHAASEDRDDE